MLNPRLTLAALLVAAGILSGCATAPEAQPATADASDATAKCRVMEPTTGSNMPRRSCKPVQGDAKDVNVDDMQEMMRRSAREKTKF